MTQNQKVKLPSYQIRIVWSTGDTFTSQVIESYLEFIFTDEQEAKDAVSIIERDYELYNESKDICDFRHINIKVNEKEQSVYPFWKGYFENLNDICVVQSSELNVERQLCRTEYEDDYENFY